MAEPAPGVSYLVVLGSSLTGRAGGGAAAAAEGVPPPPRLATLRLDFIPASVAPLGEGRLRLYEESKSATLELPALAAGPEGSGGGAARFSGRWEPAPEAGGDCVAIFDASQQCWRLEAVAAAVTLRHVADERRRGGRRGDAAAPAAPAPAPTPAASAPAAPALPPPGELSALEREFFQK
jgi:hypothetical protein